MTKSRQSFYDGTPQVIQIQSILYKNDVESIKRSLLFLQRAAQIARRMGTCEQLYLSYGDCSPAQVLSDNQVNEYREHFKKDFKFEYRFFANNFGSAKGHNLLAAESCSDFLLIMNPDVLLSPSILNELLVAFRSAGVGIAEAKQLPIEHPKDYDPTTGETSWASTATAMVPADLFRKLNGFDSDTFFLYCDDVDFSWRVRLEGYKVVFLPNAVVFHDKRLSPENRWQPTPSERYYAAEAALLMAHKWSRPDLVKDFLANFQTAESIDHRKAAKAYLERARQNHLPAQVDPEHRIGTFIKGGYAEHRFNI